MSRKAPHTIGAGFRAAGAVSALALIAYSGVHPVRAQESPFTISVDGARQGSGAAAKQDRRRQADLALYHADLRMTFDGLGADPLLNVSTVPPRHTYRAGDAVRFLATSNYPGFIARSEIVIEEDVDGRTPRAVAAIPVRINGEAAWTMPADSDGDYRYFLRVYDGQGRFDETEPLPLARSAAEFDAAEGARESVAPGTGEDRTARRNIPVRGGAVTVSGSNVPRGGAVRVLGEDIPVDGNGRFVVQRILPPGAHDIAVAVDAPGRRPVEIVRNVTIPENEWFFVGLGDYTIGHRTGSPGIETVKPGEYDRVYQKGRLAFYLKGKIKGEYILTAAADTGEEEVRNLFRGLDEKNARAVLRRLDPDDYYPVYGDDSTTYEDAPTQGKFYVRLEKGDSHVMWGNYKTHIKNTQLLRSERALYGASAQYRSPQTTRFGERRTEVTLYAAQPGTLPQRDVFRGTGGSAYFLKHQDVTTGSETVTAEVRDPVTGVLIERIALREGVDYDIDYIQGVIILRRPLPSITSDSGPVRSGALGGDEIFLIVQYEYTPAVTDVGGYVYGGRAEHWIDERIRIAVTGMSEKTATADQQAFGADILLRHSDDTWIEAEVAGSRGPGFGSSFSADGGLSISDNGPQGNRSIGASAWRIKGQADLGEVSGGRLSGSVGGYYEFREAGFETLSENVSVDQRIFGAHAQIDVSDRVTLGAKYDDYSDDNGKRQRNGTGTLEFRFNDRWKLAFGLEYTELWTPGTTKAGYNGSRADAGVRLEYQYNEDQRYYVFAQGTLDRSGDIRRNDRVGVGAEIRLSDKVSLSGEVSYGTTGLGALGTVNYNPTADDHYYIGYRLDPDRAWADETSILDGRDRGAVVAGLKRRMADTLSVFSEAELDLFGSRHTLTQTYGVTYTPDTRWTFTGGFEAGEIADNSIDPATGFARSDFDRKAGSLSVVYSDAEQGLKARLRGEYRRERSTDGSRDLDTWLVGAGIVWNPNEDWRVLANADVLIADGKGTSIRDGEYAEASIAFAYRPVEHNRFNALFKYTWLHDLPGPDQVNVAGDLLGPAQRSHILSIDGNWNVDPRLTLGAKYGMRIGETRARGTTDWTRSSAHLGVVRADIHVIKKWDLLLEGRVLHLPEIGNTKWGFLAAAYRHVGDNFKIGIGYNFGSFSDDLRDLTFDDQGVFLNLVAKF